MRQCRVCGKWFWSIWKSVKVCRRKRCQRSRNIPRDHSQAEKETTTMAKSKDESPPFKKAVPVDLSATDKAKKEKRLVKAPTERKKVKAEAKEATATHRKTINDLDKEIDAIREQLEIGTEMREVMCVARKDYRNNVVKTVRKDTGAVVETREMTPEERQESFPEVPSKGKKGAKTPGEALRRARGAEDDGENDDHGAGVPGEQAGD